MKTVHLLLLLLFIFFPINAHANHFSSPIATPVSCDYYIHLSVNGVPAELNDAIAFFDPQGNICGLYQIENITDDIIVHVYGDNSETSQDEGAIPNDELMIRVWDHSESKEYEYDSLLLSSITPDSQYFSSGQIPPVWHAEKGFGISVDTKPYYQIQQISPMVCSYIGQVNLINGLAPPGTEIGVFDPDGVLCGTFRIKTAGQYGMLHVYGDDPGTTIDEGADDGDILTFRIMDSQNQVEIQSNAILTTPGEKTGSFISSENPPVWRNLTGYHLHLNQNNDTTIYPIAQTRTVNGYEDQSFYIVLTAIDPDHGPLWYEISIDPAHGQLILIDEEEGDCYYTPDPNFYGTDTFWFTAENIIGVTDTARITIQIESINDPPLANSQSITIAEDQSSFIFLTGHDPDSEIEEYEIVQPASHGALILMDATTGLCRYMPRQNYSGMDVFFFVARDQSYASEPVPISITITPVNDPPQLISSPIIELYEDETVSFTVIVNDLDNDPISYELLSPPEHGQLTGQWPSMTYSPFANYFGKDSFILSISDQTESLTEVFEINVLPINDPPTASAFAPLTGYEGIPIQLNASQSEDIETKQLSYLWELPDLPCIKIDNPFAISPTLTPPELASPQSIFLTLSVTDEGNLSDQDFIELLVIPMHTIQVQASEHGQISPNGNFSVSYNESLVFDIQQDSGYLIDQFIVNDVLQTVFDNRFELNYITTDYEIFVSFKRINQAPLVENQKIQTPLNEPIQFQLSASDPDNDTMNITLDKSLLSGQITLDGIIATYTPLTNFFDRDHFSYKVSDGQLESKIATVDIWVGMPIVDAIVVEDINQAIELPLKSTIVTFPQKGDLHSFVTDIIYMPQSNANGLDQFQYEWENIIYDFKIYIKPVNDPPQLLSPTSIEIFEDETIDITLIVNDPEKDPISIEILNAPEHGQLTGQYLSYTLIPESNFFGEDSFVLYMADQMDSLTAVVHIDVKPVNDPPTAKAFAPLTAYEGIPILLDASQSEDIETKQLSYLWELPDLPGIKLDNPFSISPTLTPPELAAPQSIFLTLSVTDEGNLSDQNFIELLVIPMHTIRVLADEHGQISPNGNFSVSNNESVVFSIQPDSDYQIDQFIVDNMLQIVSDNRFELNSITKDHDIFVSFKRINQAPVAENQKIQTPLNGSIQFQLTVSDPDNDMLDITLDTSLLTGQIKLDAFIVTYTPLTDFCDRDHFSYKVSDGQLESKIASVDIWVGMPIVDVIVVEDMNQRIELPSKAAIVTFPQKGDMHSFVTDIIYMPHSNANGLDQFQYEWENIIYDFKIYIKAVNDPPIAKTASIFTVTERQSVMLDARQSYDIDNDPLNFYWNTTNEITISDPFALTPNITAPLVDDAGMNIPVTLTVTDPSGLTSQALTSILVQDMPDPIAVFDFENADGVVPLNVKFMDQSIHPESWFWEFGDGATSIKQHPMHVYTSAGSYSVTLTVKNSGGINQHMERNCIHAALEPLSVDFNVSGNQGVIPYTVTFYPRITGELENWLWDFGDGTISYDFQPTHVYNTIGQYTVTLSASRLTETVQKNSPGLIQTTGHQISGSVIGSDSNTGLAGYRIDINLMDAFIASTRTDEHGFYTIENLEPSSRYIVSAWPSDSSYVYQFYYQKKYAFEATWVATGIPDQQINFSMQPAPNAWVSGTVTNGVSPLSNVQVDIYSQILGIARSETTQNNGSYTFTGLEIASDYRVSVFALEKQFFFAMQDGGIVGVDHPTQSVFIESQATPITPSEKGLCHIDIIVNPVQGAFIAGTVINEKDQPMPGIHVNAWSDILNVGGSAFSDTNGRYTITGLKTVLSENAAQTGYYVEIQPVNFMYQVFNNVMNRKLATRVASNRTDIDFHLNTQGRIEGFVSSLTETPISGADIRAWSLSDMRGLLYQTKSNIDGMFQLTLPVAADYIISMKAENYAIQYYSQVISPDLAQTISLQHGNVSEIQFILDKGPIIKGYVYDKVFGEAATESTVVIESQILGTIQTIQADSSGFFKFSGLNINISDYVISVFTDGYLPAYYADNMDGHPENDTVFDSTLAGGVGAASETSATDRYLTIKQGLTVSGRIRNNQDFSIAGAIIQFKSDQGIWKTTSDNALDMNFAVTGLLSGTYELIVTAENHLTYQDQLTVTDDQTIDILMIPEPYRNIYGTVNQLETGTQIDLIVWSQTREIYKSQTLAGTGEAVAYSFSHLPPSVDYIVYVRSSIYADQYYPDKNRQEDAFMIDLSDQDAFHIDFVLTKNLSLISGQLNFEETPTSGETVRLEARSEKTGGFGFSQVKLTASRQIDYTITGLLPSDDYIVYFQSACYQNRYWDDSDTGVLSVDLARHLATPGRADFMIDDGIRISGIVTDKEGLPMTVQVEVWSQSTQTQKVTKTDTSGKYVVDGLLEADDYRIKITTKKNGVYYYHSSGTVRQEALSQAISTFDGDLEKMDMIIVRGGQIEGIIQTHTGQRIEGVWVSAWSNSQHVGGGIFSDADGKYLIYDLPHWHDYIVTVEPAWNMPYEKAQQTTVSVPSEQINFILRHKKGLSISGIIRDPSGKPVHKAIVKMQYVNQNKRPAWTITDAKGLYIIDLLTPFQTYNLEITPPKNKNWAIENRIIDLNTDQSADIMLSSGYIFSGKVFDSSNQNPLANALVTIWSASKQFAGETTSKANGQFEIKYVPMASDYVFTIKAKSFLDIKLKEQTPVQNMDIQMDSSGQISGIVRSLITGAPIENAFIEIYSQANQALADYKGVVSTNDQGKFLFTGFKPMDRNKQPITDFVVTACASGFPPMSQTGKKPGDTVVFNLAKSAKNELSGMALNLFGQMLVIDIFSESHTFVKTVMAQGADFIIDGLRPNQGYILKFIALTFTGDIHEEWAGENDLGTLELNQAKIYTAPDQISFTFSFINKQHTRFKNQDLGPGPVQKLRSLSHTYVVKNERKRSINSGSNIPSNNPNVVVTWEPPVENHENIVGYYSQFDTQESNEINKFNITPKPPVRTRKITSRDLSGDDVQYYFHVAAVDKAGRIGETQSIAFRIDTTPPTNIQVIAPEICEIRNISLMLGATGASEMYISNTSYNEGGQWENISNRKTWQLTDGAGTKNIYARFRDRAGNATQAAEITLFQPPLPTYVVKVTSDFHGTITPSGSIAVSQGDSLTFIVSPEMNYTIAQFLVDSNIETINDNIFVLSDIQKTHQIHVSFEKMNLRPIAVSNTFYGKEDSLLEGILSGIDQNDDDLRFEIVQTPDTGILNVLSYTRFTYQPAANQHGLFYLQFTASDGQLVSEPGVITLVVEAENDPPHAMGQSVETKINTPVEIMLSTTDIDNDSLSFKVDTQSPHGTVIIQGQKAIFTPKDKFNGRTEFTFKAFDGQLFSNPARIEIWVGLPPVDTILDEDNEKALTIPSDAIFLTPPVKGTFSNGIYTPFKNLSGNDVIYYQANGIIHAHSLYIKPVNDPPIITSEHIILKEDQSIDFLLTANDIENDPVTFSIVSTPQMGFLQSNLPMIKYTPYPDLYGNDQLIVEASDGMDAVTKTLIITIQAVNDPPVTKDLQISIMPIAIPVSFTLEATDKDTSDNLSYTIIKQPQAGILSGADANWTYTQNHWGIYEFQFIASDGQSRSNTGTVTLYMDMPVVNACALEDTDLDIYDYLTRIAGNKTVHLSTFPAHGRMLGSTEKGIWGYRPNHDYYGTDEFSYILGQDVHLYHFKIYVYPVNDPPKVDMQELVTTNEDCAITIEYRISDVDTSSKDLSIETVKPENGQITQLSEAIVYQPAMNFNGNDLLTLVVSDGENTNSVDIQITVLPVNDPPEALSQQIKMLEDSSQIIELQGTDIDNEHLTFQQLTDPLHGKITGTMPFVTYTPDPDSIISDEFQFRVSDGDLTSSPATVKIDIKNINDPPQANGMQFTIDQPGSLTGTLDATEIDPDILIYSLVDYPKFGDVIITNALKGEFIYYAPETSGEDYFTFKVNDGYMDSNTATVFFNINTPSEIRHILKLSLTPPYTQGDSYRYMIFDESTGKLIRDNLANTATVETRLPENYKFRLFILSSKYQYYEYQEMIMPSDDPISITLTPLSAPRKSFTAPDISQTIIDDGFYLNITSNDLIFNDIKILESLNPDADGFSEITPTSEKNIRKLYRWNQKSGQYSSIHTSESGCTYYTIDIKLIGETKDYSFSVNYESCVELEKNKTTIHKKFESTYGPTQTQTTLSKTFYPMEGTNIRLNIKDNNETLPVIIPPIPLEYLFIDTNDNLPYDPETDIYKIFDPKIRLDAETPLMAKISYYTFDKNAPGSAVSVSFFVAYGQYKGCAVRYNPIVNISGKRYDEIAKQKAPSILIPLVLNNESSDYSCCYQDLIENQQVNLFIDEKGDGVDGFREHIISATFMDGRSDVVLLSVDHLTGFGFAKEINIDSGDAEEDSGSGGCFLGLLVGGFTRVY